MTKNGKQRVRRRSQNRWSNFQAKENSSALARVASPRRESGSGSIRGNNSASSDNRIDVPEITTFLDDTYREVLEKFRRLRERISSSQPENVQQTSNRCLVQNDDSDLEDCTCDNQQICHEGKGTEKITTTKIGGINCDYIQETVIQRSMLVGSNIQTTSRHIIKRCDKNGHIEVEVKESKHVCGAEQFGATNTDLFEELTDNNQSTTKKHVEINQNVEKTSKASEQSTKTETNVRNSTSLSKMRPKPITKTPTNSSGIRVRYEEDSSEVPQSEQTQSASLSAGHKPLECCKCICDFCSSRIAQTLLLEQLDQQINDIMKKRLIEGRQELDGYPTGEMSQLTEQSNEEKECRCCSSCSGKVSKQNKMENNRYQNDNRSSFCGKQARTSMMLPPSSEYGSSALDRKPLLNDTREVFPYAPYYEDPSNYPPAPQPYSYNDDPRYYTASDGMAANQFYQNEPRYSQRYEQEYQEEYEMNQQPPILRPPLTERDYPIERIDEISAPSYPSLTSLSGNDNQDLLRQPPKLPIARLAESRQTASVCPPKGSKDLASRVDNQTKKLYCNKTTCTCQDQGTNTTNTTTKTLSRFTTPKLNSKRISKPKNCYREISVQTRIQGICGCENKATSTHDEDFPSEDIDDIMQPSSDCISDARINVQHNTSCCSSATVISARTVNSKIIAEILIPNNFDCELLVDGDDNICPCRCNNRNEKMASDGNDEELSDEVVVVTSPKEIQNSETDEPRESSDNQIKQRQRSITFAKSKKGKGKQSGPKQNINDSKEKDGISDENRDRDDEEEFNKESELANSMARDSASPEELNKQSELSNSMDRNSASPHASKGTNTPPKKLQKVPQPQRRNSNNIQDNQRRGTKVIQVTQRRSTNTMQRRTSQGGSQGGSQQQQASRIPRPIQNGNGRRRSNSSQPSCTVVCCDCTPICPFRVDPCCPKPPPCRRK